MSDDLRRTVLRKAPKVVRNCPRCDDDFYCGECPDCLTGEHPANRFRHDRGSGDTPESGENG